MGKKLRGHAAALNAQEILDLLDELRYPHDCIAGLCYWTASRIGEVLPLGSHSVVGEDLLIYQSKTDRGKAYPITGQVRAIIERLPTDGLWFPGRQSGCLTSPAFEKELNRAAELLGWDRRGIRTHTFRRSRATNLDAAGVPHKYIMQVTGHRSLSSFERYLDADHATVRETLIRIDAGLAS